MDFMLGWTQALAILVYDKNKLWAVINIKQSYEFSSV